MTAWRVTLEIDGHSDEVLIEATDEDAVRHSLNADYARGEVRTYTTTAGAELHVRWSAVATMRLAGGPEQAN